MKTQAEYDAEIEQMRREIDEAMRAMTDANIRLDMRKVYINSAPVCFLLGWICALAFFCVMYWIMS